MSYRRRYSGRTDGGGGKAWRGEEEERGIRESIVIINPGHASERLPHETVKTRREEGGGGVRLSCVSNKNRMHGGDSGDIARSHFACSSCHRRAPTRVRFASFELLFGPFTRGNVFRCIRARPGNRQAPYLVRRGETRRGNIGDDSQARKRPALFIAVGTEIGND